MAAKALAASAPGTPDACEERHGHDEAIAALTARSPSRRRSIVAEPARVNADAVRALLARFDAELRIDPPAEVGFRFERSNGVVRAVGPYQWIVWWTFGAAECDAVVGAEARAFTAAGAKVEWKVYGHDAPANLSAALERHGFVPDPPETLMVLDLDAVSGIASGQLPPGVTIRRVTAPSELDDYVRATTLGFEEDAAWMIDALAPQLFCTDPRAAAFVAYVDGQPAGAGRIECPAGRAFASIWGGTTVAPFRRRGIFRALVAARAAHARGAGYRYLLVEAREASRPILEAIGFVRLTSVVGWFSRPAGAVADTA